MRRSLVSVSVCLLLGGCVGQGSSLRVDVTKLTSELREVRRLQAEHTAELAELRNEVRSVSGRLDEFEYTAGQKIGSLARLKDDLSSINRRLPPPSIVPITELEADELMVQRLPSEVAHPFGQALASIRSGKFEDAESTLQQALDMGFSDKCGANVVFWQGVVAEARDDDRRALSSYSEVVARYPKHERAASALLRQGLLFSRVGDKKAAQATFKKLIAEHAKSRPADQARQKLKEL